MGMELEELQEITTCFTTVWPWSGKIGIQDKKKEIQLLPDEGDCIILPQREEGGQADFLNYNWLEAVRQCAHLLDQQGRKTWLFDDYEPSGHGNESVTSVPSYRQKALLCVRDMKEGDKPLLSVSYHGARYTVCVRTSSDRRRADLLSAEAMEVFLRNCRSEYKRTCRRQMGEEITGFYTNCQDWFCPKPYGGKAYPYTDGLFQAFQERYGYDLRENLDKLFFPLPGFEAVRYEYAMLARHLFEEAFVKPYAQACAQEGLRFGGCFPGEGCFLSHVEAPVLMAGEEETQGAAHGALQLGKQPLWMLKDAKAYGQAKRQMEKGLLSGCTHFAGTFLKSPETERFLEYTNRLASCLADGTEPVRILLLSAAGSELVSGELGGPYFTQQQRKVETLLRDHQFPFHTGDEALLKEHATVQNKSVCVGQFRYDIAIVPPSLTLSSQTISLLEQMEHVFLLAPYPYMVNGREDRYDLLENAIRLETAEELLPLLEQRMPLRATASPGVRVKTVKKGENTWYLVANAGGETVKTELCLPTEQLPYLADAYTGSIYRAPAIAKGDRMVIPLTLTPYGSTLAYVSNERLEAEDYPLALPGGVLLREPLPLLAINQFTVTKEGARACYAFALSRQGKGRLTVRLSEASCQSARLKVNGEEVELLLWEPYLFDVTGLLTEEVNTIEVELSGENTSLKTVMLLGNA